MRSASDAQLDRFTRNTYKVLLTCGMVGTLIYPTDEKRREFMRKTVRAWHPRCGDLI